jgi:hypothetical protein
MYILTVSDKDQNGAFAVESRNGEKVLFLFEEKDDVIRYKMMLEELDYPDMDITEVNTEVAISACDQLDYDYAIITSEDIVIPPDYDKV